MKIQAILVSLLLSAQVAAQAAPATYAIKLHRPFKAGTKFELSYKSTLKRVRTIDGVADMNDKNEVVLSGLGEVVEVDSIGRPKQYKFKVKECTANGKVLVSPGMEMSVERGPKGRPQFLVGGSFLSVEKSQLLTSALPLGQEGQPTDDQVFGTAKRQPVGGTWPANGALAAASFQSVLPQAQGTTVQGRCKLEQVKKVNGLECLIISGVVKSSGGMSMTSTMLEAYPVDVKQPRQESSGSMHFAISQPRVSVVIDDSNVKIYNFDVKEEPHITPAMDATSAPTVSP